MTTPCGTRRTGIDPHSPYGFAGINQNPTDPEHRQVWSCIMVKITSSFRKLIGLPSSKEIPRSNRTDWVSSHVDDEQVERIAKRNEPDDQIDFPPPDDGGKSI